MFELPVRPCLSMFTFAAIVACQLPQHTPPGATLNRLAALKPNTIAVMHGSSFSGNGEQALKDLASVMKEVLGEEAAKTQ